MKTNFQITFGLALACAAITLSLRVCAQAQTFTVLSNFNGRSAYPPDATFIQGTSGDLYDASVNGGTGHGGNVFSITPAGQMTDLYNFCLVGYPTCADGLDPDSIVVGSDGNLYGTTSAGTGSFGGTLFKMTPGGKESTVYTFTGPVGSGPNGIVLGSDGNFYGTTATTIFKVTPSGAATLLYTFPCGVNGCWFGWNAEVPPIQGIDGNFYGTASNGALNNSGTVYKITPDGQFSVLHRFCSWTNCTDGQFPKGLVEDASGNLYGIAGYGGAAGNDGTLFEITPANRFIVLHTFDVTTLPQSLMIANDGNLYGTTATGGSFGGSIFQITPQGVYSELYQFSTGDDGTEPEHLFQATDGIFYGTTYTGGSFGYGEAYSFSYNLSPLVKTVPAAGHVGESVIILGNGLTGTTSVTFNGVAATFAVESDTYIKAAVPAGATTGVVSVVTPSRTLKSNPQFVVAK